MPARRNMSHLISYFEGNFGELTNTIHFLKSVKFTIAAIKKFGASMLPVVYILKRDVMILFNRYKKNPSRYRCLEQMIMEEKFNNGVNGKTNSSRALLSILRHLNFIILLVRFLVDQNLAPNAEKDLKAVINDAQINSLAYHQEWFGRKIMNVLVKNSPITIKLLCILWKKHFVNKNYFHCIHTFFRNMLLCVKKLEIFYHKNGIEDHLW
ncbi:uncharacterized protein LOC126265414 [Aethina tumida]|uniref:uncharacterized protein LOC126265414 n=1 Tax=Aethina tumida TaxID=116153 RepID=UPI0021473402|nr:uncharacterized protein LOC126265414 [Aethina tumida]